MGPAAVAALIACGPGEQPEAADGPGLCESPTTWAALPDEVQETSGLAASHRHAGVFWTHNDSGGDSAVFALDSTGAVLARVRIRGATNRDWEDVEAAPCAAGGDGACLFIGDIGDNAERRERVVVYRVPEPGIDDSISARADRFEIVYPAGARDAEALFVTDAGIHLVTKGRSQAVELYRVRPPYRPDQRHTLERVQQLAPPPTSVSAQVTAAAAAPDGATIAVRTYSSIRFFEPDADTLRPLGAPVDLVGPSQMQGEGVDFLGDSRLVLTGEGGRQPATISVVRCDLRRAR